MSLAKHLAKTLLVVVLFLAIGVTQAASLSPVHQHDHGDSHCCDLCHPGHIPVVITAGTGHIPLARTAEWRKMPIAADSILSVSVSRASSRAPPQL
jgi:hypothetical protein